MNNEQSIFPNLLYLANEIQDKNFIIDKSGVKMVEILAPKIILDPNQMTLDFGERSTNIDYILKEMDWYDSANLNIKQVEDVKIWKACTDSRGEINSNYGNLVFSRNNYSQFDNIIKTLKNHKESRQAIIIYTRPSIHYEWNSHQCSDFICTNFQHFFIRNNKLHCITSMRSCDAVFGMMNDIPWFHEVINRVLCALISEGYNNLSFGEHHYIPNSLHVYERHFKMLINLVNNFNNLN